MRRYFALIIIIMLGTVAAVSARQEEPTRPSEASQDAILEVSLHTIAGNWSGYQLVSVPDPSFPSALSNVQPANTCEDAGDSDDFLFTLGTGTVAPVNSLTSPGLKDPALSCMWGSPGLLEGYRTAWFRFIPDFNGPIRFTTLGTNYDTILAVHQGECGLQTELVCNDDNNFFSSEATLNVRAGETYFLEVADWHLGVQGSVILSLASAWLPVTNNWQVVSRGNETQAQRSRHVAEVYNGKIYVIGGQKTVSGSIIRTGAVDIFDTSTRNWSAGSSMPQFGYSNTTAAVVNGNIYIPAGFVGHPVTYEGVHWVYNISNNSWTKGLAAPLWPAGPAIYSAAAAFRVPIHGNGYFLTGGLTGRFPPEPPDEIDGWEAHNEVYYYSVDFNAWDRFIAPDMITGRFGHVAEIVPLAGKDHICVAGGLGKQVGKDLRETLDSAECFDPDGSSASWFTIAPLNHARYFASSGVDDAGNWFVIGGFNADGTPIPVTERYDADLDEWIELNIRYDLGVVDPNNPFNITRPPRAWAKGDFVGEKMYVVGGETIGSQVVNLVERSELPKPVNLSGLFPAAYLSLIINGTGEPETNSTFKTALATRLNQSHQNNYLDPNDFVDAWTFELSSFRQVTIEVDPYTSGYDLRLYLYTEDKEILEISPQPGTQVKTIKRQLPAGQYYVMIERLFPGLGLPPSSGDYRFIVRG